MYFKLRIPLSLIPSSACFNSTSCYAVNSQLSNPEACFPLHFTSEAGRENKVHHFPVPFLKGVLRKRLKPLGTTDCKFSVDLFAPDLSCLPSATMVKSCTSTVISFQDLSEILISSVLLLLSLFSYCCII